MIAIFGSQTKLAAALGLSNNAISKWVAEGFIPPGRVLSVYQLIEGKKTPSGERVSIESLLIESSNLKSQ